MYLSILQLLSHELCNHNDVSMSSIEQVTKTRKGKTTLWGKNILIEVTTGQARWVGASSEGLLNQYYCFETMMDSFRDLCEAGAKVSLHVTSSNNYPVYIIDELNSRIACRNVNGSLNMTIHIKSADWGKQMVDFHRKLFYDNLNNYDLFVHNEEDQLIRPTNIIAFIEETQKLEKLVGNKRLTDYSIGFVRFENEMEHDYKRRVIWEHDWPEKLHVIDHEGIAGRYFTTPPPWHHQGMYMATRLQLERWATRPNCAFDRVQREVGYHRERVSGAANLYAQDRCNVTQLLPLDSFQDFLIHHLPNKNYKRRKDSIRSVTQLHQDRLKAMQRNPLRRVDSRGAYNGIRIVVDEKDKTKSLDVNLTDYEAYVARGGVLPADYILVE